MRPLSEIIQHYLRDGNRNKWYYYNERGENHLGFQVINEILTNPGEFVKKYLLKGLKEPEIYELLDIPLFKARMTHTVSIFFFGIILYDKIEYITKCIDKYLVSLEIEIMEKDPDHEYIKLPFCYYWFLVCFYHDMGYFSINNPDIRLFNKESWEDKELEVRSILEILINKGNGIPDFIKNSSFNYMEYRKKEYQLGNQNEPIDHGFLSGTYYYYNREKKFKEIFSRLRNHGKNSCIENGLHWSRFMMEIVHPTISWNIISHNMWFSKEIDGEKYRDNGLNDLITNHPKVKIGEFPLYFLLCFVDTIDFVKYFVRDNSPTYSEDTKNVLEKISFDNSVNSKSFEIQITDLDFNEFYKKIKKNESWLGIRIKQAQNNITFTFS